MNNVYELLLEQEIVRVQLLLDIRNLNFLLNKNNTTIIQNDINKNENEEEINPLEIVTSAGTKVETPIYLVEQWKNMNLIELSLPHCYQPKFLETLDIGGEEANLCESSDFYFELGSRFAQLQSMDDVDEDVVENLRLFLGKIFSKRLKKIVLYSHNSRKPNSSEFIATLTKFERNLFEKAKKSAELFDNWRFTAPNVGVISTPSIVSEIILRRQQLLQATSNNSSRTSMIEKDNGISNNLTSSSSLMTRVLNGVLATTTAKDQQQQQPAMKKFRL